MTHSDGRRHKEPRAPSCGPYLFSFPSFLCCASSLSKSWSGRDFAVCYTGLRHRWTLRTPDLSSFSACINLSATSKQAELNLIQQHLFTNCSTKRTLHLHLISVSAVVSSGKALYPHWPVRIWMLGGGRSGCWAQTGSCTSVSQSVSQRASLATHVAHHVNVV